MKFRELRIQKPRRPPTASELHFPVRIKVKRWPGTAKPYPLSIAIYAIYLFYLFYLSMLFIYLFIYTIYEPYLKKGYS